MSDNQFLDIFGDYPQIRVIDFFLDNLYGRFNKTEISEFADVSRTTLQTICKDLVNYGFLIEEKKGNMELYSINRGNKFVEKLIDLTVALSLARVEKEINTSTVVSSVITYKVNDYPSIEMKGAECQ